MTVADAAVRETALDPLRSFCVTAPAGSGKTELLIQRYLGLLARVERPEQVLAITFTRKAAAEMRERVLGALEEARRADPVESPHQARTRELALAALAADERREWHLSRSVNRLNIKTIDGFCSGLTRQMPVLSRFGGDVSVTDDCDDLYAEAVAALFRRLELDEPVAGDLGALLAHFDNDWGRVQELLCRLLQRRDQWRGYTGVRHDPEEAGEVLRLTAREAVEDALAPLARGLAPWGDQLLAMQRYAAGHLGVEPWAAFPRADAADLAAWRLLRALLLTGKGEWRRSLNRRDGFPADDDGQRRIKRDMLDLLTTLAEHSGEQAALAAVDFLPDLQPGGRSWELALHLAHLLPVLAAELLLVFARRGRVDHSQVALSALEALGEDEAPTELALRLDYRIEHILVDEFQDTAISQFELVRRLTRGWDAHNAANPRAPRTVFIVGDGMQSIYGFRDANVGLFIKAQQEGFNGVVPMPLALCCNFRSDGGVVDWLNACFAPAFPAENDARRGQVAFSRAVAVRPEGSPGAVRCLAYHGEQALQQQTVEFCDLVEQGQGDPECRSIALLGRTRAVLQPLITELRRRGIAYSAQDIDSLADSPPVVDLLSLCRALANPADRIAWLALLRAPWCGLTLSDLHVLGSARQGREWLPVPLLLSQPQRLAALSPDGRIRVDHLRGALRRAEERRDRLALRVWLEQLWLELQGPATLTDPGQMQDAERFFQLLEEADRDGPGLDPRWLQQKTAALRLSSERPDSKVQVMTLHKAKGLEFDWVLLPTLDRTPRRSDSELLLWDDYTSAHNRRGFLLAADDRGSDGDCSLYAYLKRQRREKSLLEATRLLYVGATRAARRLTLGACLEPDVVGDGWKPPRADSLLRSIWDGFRASMAVREPSAAAPEMPSRGPHRLARVSVAAAYPAPGDSAGQSGANIPQRALNRVERHVGSVVHLALEELALAAELPGDVSAADRRRWRLELRRLGLSGGSLEQAVERVTQSVATSLASPEGRWVLSSGHPEARVEWALSAVDGDGAPRDLVIDRCFVCEDSGDRWIVDYKTGEPAAGESVETFLLREAEHYRAQLMAYSDAVAGISREPVRCALFFTCLGRLHHLPGLDRPGRGE